MVLIELAEDECRVAVFDVFVFDVVDVAAVRTSARRYII